MTYDHYWLKLKKITLIKNQAKIIIVSSLDNNKEIIEIEDNEGIRTEIREFLNSLESNHSGIKNNMYNTILKLSQFTNQSIQKEKRTCLICGNECTSKICSVCDMITDLKGK